METLNMLGNAEAFCIDWHKANAAIRGSVYTVYCTMLLMHNACRTLTLPKVCCMPVSKLVTLYGSGYFFTPFDIFVVVLC